LTCPGCYHYPCAVIEDSIVLIGMAGVGKSTIGASLAEVLRFDFIDLDQYLSLKVGKTIQGIIDGQGESRLLEMERQSMREIDLHHKVISPGGSIIYNPDIMEYLKRSSYLVYLDDTFENIRKRLGNAATRGIVGLKSRSLREIFDERRPLYSRYADVTIDVGEKSRQAVVAEIITFIKAPFPQ
jgi:shikimate kinase